MNQNYNIDENQENTELQYWDEEENSFNSENECQFTICFYCNEEIEVDYIPYHQCVEEPNYWDDNSQSIDFINNEYNSEEEDNASRIDELDAREIDNEFINLEDFYFNNLKNNSNNSNSSSNNNDNNSNNSNSSSNNNDNNSNYSNSSSNNTISNDNLYIPDRSHQIPIHEIPDILRGRLDLPANNFSQGLHSALDKDILYADNYQKWCNILVLNDTEECNVCLHKKNKFHHFKVCHHRICEDCSFKWFDNNSTCPICRSDITKLPNVSPILTSGYRKICV